MCNCTSQKCCRQTTCQNEKLVKLGIIVRASNFVYLSKIIPQLSPQNQNCLCPCCSPKQKSITNIFLIPIVRYALLSWGYTMDIDSSTSKGTKYLQNSVSNQKPGSSKHITCSNITLVEITELKVMQVTAESYVCFFSIYKKIT